MAFELPVAVYSPELMESVKYEIESYLEWYRQAKIHAKLGSKTGSEPSHSAETDLVIRAWLGDKAPTLELLEQLVKHIGGLKLPIVHVTLAAIPNQSHRAKLVEWFRQAAGGPVLVSFVADRSIGGGAMVRTPNRVFDFSWRQSLLAARGKMAGIINRV